MANSIFSYVHTNYHLLSLGHNAISFFLNRLLQHFSSILICSSMNKISPLRVTFTFVVLVKSNWLALRRLI